MNVFEKILLKPLASIYGFCVTLRNALFDLGALKSRSFNVPIICVGNATVGGTGKTPHTEYIVSVLSKKYRVATLSRGYKRKSKGFILATPATTAAEIGDEPMQIYRKFPNVIVSCCEKRVVGIKRLLSLPEPPQVIVLDDAYQHRYVKAGMNILLCDYNRPIYKDKLLPLGRLREGWKSAIHRATHVIVTKCPDNLTPLDRRVVMTSLDMYPYQSLYYSRVSYGKPMRVTGDVECRGFDEWLERIYQSGASLLVVTGIAQPKPFIRHIRKNFPDRYKLLAFADHHKYNDADLDKITKALAELPNGPKYIITTEKDAVKLSEMVLPSWIDSLYYVPIVVNFINSGKDSLSEAVLDYVAKNN